MEKLQQQGIKKQRQKHQKLIKANTLRSLMSENGVRVVCTMFVDVKRQQIINRTNLCLVLSMTNTSSVCV